MGMGRRIIDHQTRREREIAGSGEHKVPKDSGPGSLLHGPRDGGAGGLFCGDLDGRHALTSAYGVQPSNIVVGVRDKKDIVERGLFRRHRVLRGQDGGAAAVFGLVRHPGLSIQKLAGRGSVQHIKRRRAGHHTSCGEANRKTQERSRHFPEIGAQPAGEANGSSPCMRGRDPDRSIRPVYL